MNPQPVPSPQQLAWAEQVIGQYAIEAANMRITIAQQAALIAQLQARVDELSKAVPDDDH